MGLFFNRRPKKDATLVPINEATADTMLRIRDIQEQTSKRPSNTYSEEISKSFKGKELAVSEPVKYLSSIDLGQGYRNKGKKNGAYQNLHEILKELSTNIIVNSIITTRANQVARYCTPARDKEDKIGFEVFLKEEPTSTFDEMNKNQKSSILRAEQFLVNTGVAPDTSRDSFRQLIKKWVRDLMTYDQINAEKVFKDGEGSRLLKIDAVDASTIYHVIDKVTHEKPKGKNASLYAQVLEDGIVKSKWNKHEFIFEVMNPRSDIYSARYGLSPLEVAMSHVGYHTMTEQFNSKYFSQGGTTMGLLHIKTGDQVSTRALEDFRRDWQSRFSGVNGSWKIPVISADDVKYVNMNQSSRDMEFEKWLNYLINVLCANFGIDPAEINFPNRGGATGSKGNSLQEASKKETSQLSKDKGLAPIMNFLEDVINRNVMPYLEGGKYAFRFVGDSTEAELKSLEILSKETEVYKTINEARAEKGLDPIEGGDIIMQAIHVQRLGQIFQQEQLERQMQMEQQQMLADNTQGGTTSSDEESKGNKEGTEKEGVTTQDQQQGLNGKSTMSAKNQDGVKKDGQLRGEKSANSMGEGGKERNGDW